MASGDEAHAERVVEPQPGQAERAESIAQGGRRNAHDAVRGLEWAARAGSVAEARKHGATRRVVRVAGRCQSPRQVARGRQERCAKAADAIPGRLEAPARLDDLAVELLWIETAQRGMGETVGTDLETGVLRERRADFVAELGDDEERSMALIRPNSMLLSARSSLTRGATGQRLKRPK